jgi:hypothetical protein
VTASFRPTDLRSTRDFAEQVLAARRADIHDDKLDGQHWLVAVTATGADMARRRRRWTTRRAA